MFFKNKNYTAPINYLVTFFIIFSFFILSYLAPTQNSYAAKNITRSCSPPGNPSGSATASVSVSDFGSLFSDEIEVEMQNTYCMTKIIAYYVSFKVLISTMNLACGTGGPSITPSPLADSISIGKASVKQVMPSTPLSCRVAYGAVLGEWAVIAGDLAITRNIAEAVYKNTRICGANWNKYNSTTMLKDMPGDRKEFIESWTSNIKNASKNNLQNQEYREWYYDGVEREDGECKDVTKTKINDQYPPQKYYYRGSSPATFNCDKYNVRPGLSWDDPNVEKANKALSPERLKEYQEAYNCCMEKQRNSVCIEYNKEEILKAKGGEFIKAVKFDNNTKKTADGTYYKICPGDKKCRVGNVDFLTKLKYNDTMVCVDTYSLCPYNFSIGGGTDQCKPYTDNANKEDVEKEDCDGKSSIRDRNCDVNVKAGKCENYCQYLENCVVVDKNKFNYQTSITSPYFSSACIDFVGDSRNSRGYNIGISENSSQKHFSAPIVQCVKETIENVFYNKAGHTKCKNPLETPDTNGNCYSAGSIYKKGDKVETMSFFAKIQEYAASGVRVLLLLSVMLTGFKVLAGKDSLFKKTEMMKYIVKVGLIMYFVTGQAWQNMFFEGIYRASDVVSGVLFKVTVNNNEDKRDGCQFGSMINSKNEAITTTTYPAGKEYLAIWDTMDCKIARYLGMGNNANVANLFKLILASYLTGTIGLWFSIMFSIFGVMLVIATIQMVHIFLMSSISIIIMVYISVITIPMALFEKTKGIFDKWFKNLIALSIQPIILCAYIGIFIAIFDNIMVGSAVFTGDPPERRIVCQDQCFDSSGVKKEVPTGKTAFDICDFSSGDKLISPKSDSIACIIDSKNSNPISSWPGLEIIGLGFSVFFDIFSAEGRNKLEKQIITILKATLVIYILQSFIAQIPAVTSALIANAASFKLTDLDLKNAMKKIGNVTSGVVTRANRGGVKLASKYGRKGIEGMKNAAQFVGNRGKNVNSKPPSNSPKDDANSG